MSQYGQYYPKSDTKLSRLNITTKDIAIWKENMSDIFESNKNQWKLEAIERLKFELETIETNSSVCVPNQLKKIRANEGRTSRGEFKNILDTQFYNFSVMQAASCSVYSIFYGIQEENGAISKVELMKEAVTNLHQIGTESAYGYVLSGGIKNTDDLFVVKVPQNENVGNDLLHELFVGLMGTNIMRKYVPNFVFVYGGFKCSKPVIDKKTKDVISWCSAESGQMNVPYIVYENISNSIPLAQYVKTCSKIEYISNLLQVFMALNAANAKIGFTHYDLHDNNVLCRDVSDIGFDGDFNIPYVKPNQSTIYIRANKVATIIDFGQSYIEYKGRGYGTDQIALYKHGVSNNKWPLYDVYKLIMFSALSARSATPKNLEVLAVAELMFRFFNQTENFDNALSLQKGGLYELPPFYDDLQLTIDDFLGYVFSIPQLKNDISAVVTRTPKFKILECTECYSFMRSLATTKVFDKMSQPQNFFDFYDLGTQLVKNNEKEYINMVKSFDYKNKRIIFIKNFDDLNQLLSVQLLNVKNLTRMGINENNIMFFNIMDVIRQNNNDLLKSIEILESSIRHFKVGMSIAKLYEDNELIKHLQEVNGLYEEYETQMHDLIRNSTDIFVQYVYPFINNRQLFIDYYQKDERLYWYYTSSADITGLTARLNNDERKFKLFNIKNINDLISPNVRDDLSNISKKTQAIPNNHIENNLPIIEEKKVQPIIEEKKLVTPKKIVQINPAPVVVPIPVQNKPIIKAEPKPILRNKINIEPVQEKKEVTIIQQRTPYSLYPINKKVNPIFADDGITVKEILFKPINEM